MPDNLALNGSAPRLTVLVVDDMPSSRMETAAQVQQAGHTPLEASSGAEALQLVAAHPVDVVLMDLLMPDMDGFEATRQLRAMERPSWLPLIVMSSMTGADHFVQAIEQGADDYLIKPVSAQLLQAKLRNIGRVLALQFQLTHQSAHNRALFDHIADSVLAVDAEFLIRDANRAGLNLLGLHAIPQEGVALHSLMTSGLPPLSTQPGERLCVERLVRHPDGTEAPTEIVVSEWRHNADTYLSLILRDLSERRRLERLKDEFLSAVSHELRTPLTSILGSLSLLAGKAVGELPDKAQHLVAIAQRNGERLGRLIDDVLDLTKLEADRMSLNVRPYPLDRLLTEALQANTEYAARLGKSIVMRTAPIPQQEVCVDADRFLQIMANLLSNAVKYSPPNQPVEIRCTTDGQRAHIAVRDHGPGIPPSFRARLFEKFSQAQNDQRTSVGTGLGLHISRLLIERMDGTIAVVSTPGHGAEFSIDLPCATALKKHQRVKPRILVMDRDTVTRDRIHHLLHGMCDVQTMASLAEKLEEGAPAPSLLIADPEGAHGTLDTACTLLRRMAGPAPIMLYTDAVPEKEAIRHGFDLFRKRSTSNEQFLHAVRMTLNLPEGST